MGQGEEDSMCRLFVFGICFLCVFGLYSGCENEGAEPASTIESEPIPVLWDEPVEADNDLDYCLKVSKAAETACTTCVCTDCYDAVVECYFDEGCTYIRECSFVTGCNGADCIEECGDVIEAYTGEGTDTYALMIALASCATENCTACVGEEGATQTSGPD
jgi:hypothetical protein